MEIMSYHSFETCSVLLDLKISHFQAFRSFSGYLCCIQSIFLFYIPYILESNPHPFYSFGGLKNQMWIRIKCGLDSRSRAGFWKNDRAGVSAVRTIHLIIILFIIL
jgi:hypothetical protein